MSFKLVRDFEQAIADYFGAPYAVATDCCTHAIELSIRLRQPKELSCPTHTYISVPMTMKKLGLAWSWRNEHWHDMYDIGGDIIDAAVWWQPGGYYPGSLMALSFQHKKPLNIGRGGAILCGTLEEYQRLKAMSYDGRIDDDTPWASQSISTMGYHYYMTPEQAAVGLEKLPHVKPIKRWDWQDYPDVSKMPVWLPE
jgi:dTDP-4-amino-4,6-dideoxygalactose transaminase